MLKIEYDDNKKKFSLENKVIVATGGTGVLGSYFVNSIV